MSATDNSKGNTIQLNVAALPRLTLALAWGMAGFECQAGGVE
ncbi:hypothetical protein [Cupriavidus sp.]